jgi:glycine cleavage system H protein
VENEPDLVNQSPYGEGWMIKINLSNNRDLDTLLGPEEYKKLVDGE